MNAARTILVVDDNSINLKLAVDVLTCDGHQVVPAEDAGQAQEVLKTFHPQVILLDIQMPGMDGLTLTRLLKADPVLKGTCIIALTASAMKGVETKAREAGCDGYITKPIEVLELSNQIEKIIGSKGEPGADS